MIEYRTFQNTDPPAICNIWCNQPALRALVQPMTPAVLEKTVLSKPLFDRHGLIVAVDQGQLVGFVHAGFQPNATGSAIDTSAGATCMLMVRNRRDRSQIARELLGHSEQYLRSRGARTLFGGAVGSIAPFYFGLYGGASNPGVLEDDSLMLDLFREAGYVEQRRRLILQCSLAGFRPTMNRPQLQIRRSHLVERTPSSRPVTWWQACSIGLAELFHFALHPRNDDQPVGWIRFWDMEPLASSWGVHARGVMQLEVEPSQDRNDLVLFLVGESLKQLANDGATVAEVQLAPDDGELLHMFQTLGFQTLEQGTGFCKEIQES